jgi:transcriptional regulator with XRE-family HTH domain
MRIKGVIKERGLTLREVAQRMGVKSPSLSRAVNGNPTMEMLQRIANAMQVSVSELIEKPSWASNVHACPYCGQELEIETKVVKKHKRKTGK